MTSLNIVFAGTPAFGIPCLDALAESEHTLTAVYTQPDRPAGRGRSLHASAVKQWALAQQIPVYQPLNFKEQDTRDALAALKPDVLVVIAYGLILPKAVLEIPRLACINVHASLLPKWRGAAPIQQAILNGDAQTGITIMHMDVGMDTGDMLLKVACAIDEDDTAASLHDKLAQIAPHPLLTTLEALAQGHTKPEQQDDSLVSYAGKISKEDARIDWQRSAVEIDRQIRAFNPWPIAYTFVGEDTVRIHQAQATSIDCEQAAGTIIRLDKNGLLVATAKNVLLIEKIQFPGAKAIAVSDWINSGKTQLHPGLVLQ